MASKLINETVNTLSLLINHVIRSKELHIKKFTQMYISVSIICLISWNYFIDSFQMAIIYVTFSSVSQILANVGEVSILDAMLHHQATRTNSSCQNY